MSSSNIVTFLKGLNKDELEAAATSLKIQPSGTKDTLIFTICSKILSSPGDLQLIPNYTIKSNDEDLAAIKTFMKLQLQVEPDPKSSKATSPRTDITKQLVDIQFQQLTLINDLASSHKAKKLDDRFVKRCLSLSKSWNGDSTEKSEAWDFIESFEDLREQYEPDLKTIYSALKDCLRGRAKEWFIANYKNSKAFKYDEFQSDFLLVFLPFNHEKRIKSQIRSELQQEDETMDSFMARLANLNRKLKAPLPDCELLEIAVSNAHPRYTVQFNLISDTSVKAEVLKVDRIIEHAKSHEIEFSKKKRTQYSNYKSKIAALTVEEKQEVEEACSCTTAQVAAITKEKQNYKKVNTTVCFNCEKQGHISKNCPEPTNLHCYKCKAQGKTIRTCGCSNTPQVSAVTTEDQESKPQEN